jgi:hypothetical protein
VVVAHLSLGNPARRGQAAHRRVCQMRVGAVDESIEVRAAPSNFDDEGGVERLGEPIQGSDGDPVKPSGLGRDTRSRPSRARSARSAWRQCRRIRRLRTARGRLVRITE